MDFRLGSGQTCSLWFIFSDASLHKIREHVGVPTREARRPTHYNIYISPRAFRVSGLVIYRFSKPALAYLQGSTRNNSTDGDGESQTNKVSVGAAKSAVSSVDLCLERSQRMSPMAKHVLCQGLLVPVALATPRCSLPVFQISKYIGINQMEYLDPLIQTRAWRSQKVRRRFFVSGKWPAVG